MRGRVDLVLASDVVYWEHLHAPLLRTLHDLTERTDVPVLMAHLRRRRADKHFFREAARTLTVTLVSELPVPTFRRRIQIYRFGRRVRVPKGAGPPARAGPSTQADAA